MSNNAPFNQMTELRRFHALPLSIIGQYRRFWVFESGFESQGGITWWRIDARKIRATTAGREHDGGLISSH